MTKKRKEVFRMDGLPVYDAIRDLPFKITPHDVKVAKAKDPLHCAAAIACKREGHFATVRVHLSRAYVRRAKHWDRYIVPPSMRSEVIVLDRGGQMAPGDYMFKAPKAKSLKLGYHKPRGPHKSAGKKRIMHLVSGVRSGAPR